MLKITLFLAVGVFYRRVLHSFGKRSKFRISRIMSYRMRPACSNESEIYGLLLRVPYECTIKTRITYAVPLYFQKNILPWRLRNFISEA